MIIWRLWGVWDYSLQCISYYTACKIETGWAVHGMEWLWLRNLRAFLKRGSVLWQKERVSFAPNLTYIFLNICFLMCTEKILLPTFVVLQNSSTSPHPHPSLMKILYLDLATGLLKSTQWPFLGAGQNKGKLQVRLSFHLWFDLSAQACGAWNLSAGRDEWNRRNKLIRFSNDWVPRFQATRHLGRITNDRISHGVTFQQNEHKK